MIPIRVGTGYDVHRLAEDVKLYLGGLEIKSDLGAVGHSDADVLIHVICDAILGALNQRDIGFHFPDNDLAFKNIKSTILLQKVMRIMRKSNYEIVNLDTTLCLQIPKIAPYTEAIKSNLARIMNIAVEQVSVKATTTEGLGFVGTRQGIAAHAVVLIVKNES